MTARVSTERVRYWLVRRGSVFFAVVVLALTLLKYGAGVFPSWPLMQALARNWRHPMVSPRLAPPADYLVGSPTSAVVAGWLHLTSGRAYLGFHLVLACAAIVVPFALRPVRRSPELRLGVSLLLVGGAVPALLLDWVGSYDPVSIGAAAVAGLASNPVVRALAWAIFAFNNAPQAAFALGIYAVVMWVDRGRPAVPTIIVPGASAVAGYVGIRLLTSVWGGGESEFTMMKFYGFSHYLISYIDYWPLIALSALGAGWVFLHPCSARP